MVYEVLGRYPEAIKTYQDLLTLNPEDEKALFSLGWVLMDEKRLMEAIPLFKKAIKLKPNGRGADLTALRFAAADRNLLSLAYL